MFELVGQFTLDDSDIDDDDDDYDYPIPVQEQTSRAPAVPDLSRSAGRREAGGSRPPVKADPDDEWQEF